MNNQAYIVFDDTVIAQRYGLEIETSNRQYSGNEPRVIQGIGLVNCIYVHVRKVLGG